MKNHFFLNLFLRQSVSQLVRNILRDIVVVEAVYLVTLWLGTKWHIDQSVARKYINSWWVDVSFKFLAWILASKSNHVCMMGWPSHEEIQLSAIRPVVVAQQKHSFDLRNLFYLLLVAPPPPAKFWWWAAAAVLFAAVFFPTCTECRHTHTHSDYRFISRNHICRHKRHPHSRFGPSSGWARCSVCKRARNPFDRFFFLSRLPTNSHWLDAGWKHFFSSYVQISILIYTHTENERMNKKYIESDVLLVGWRVRSKHYVRFALCLLSPFSFQMCTVVLR